MPPDLWQTVGVPFAVIISLLVAIILIFVVLRRLADFRREQAQQTEFIKALRSEVGTDGGTTIGARFHAQDEALERMRVLAEKKAAADEAIVARNQTAADAMERTIRKLQALVEQAALLAEQNQKFNELALRYQAERIVNNISNAPTHAGGDVNRSDIGAGAQVGQAGTGRGIAQTQAAKPPPIEVIVVPDAAIPVINVTPEQK